MTTLNATTKRTYTIDEVREIDEINWAFPGIMAGYTPVLKSKMIIAESSMDYLKKYRDRLKSYDEIFGERVMEMDELISGLEARMREIQGENIKAGETRG